VGVGLQVARVLDQEPEFLRFAEKQGLIPGAEVVVRKREPAAEAVRVRIGRRAEVSLGLVAAAKILVEGEER
jgi:hypothetical protein